MRFAIFPLHLSKVLCLPRNSDARSYEVLHLSRKIILANLYIYIETCVHLLYCLFFKKANDIHIRNIRTYPHAKLDPCMPTHLHTYIHTYCTLCATPSTGLDLRWPCLRTASSTAPWRCFRHTFWKTTLSPLAPQDFSLAAKPKVSQVSLSLWSECGKIISELGHWGSSQLGVEKPRPCWGNWGCYGICAYILITCYEVEFSYARSMSSWLVPLEVFASDCNLQFSVPCNLLQACRATYSSLPFFNSDLW